MSLFRASLGCPGTFGYDQLGRLTSANNPEQDAATAFGYDVNGNLTTKNDPRGGLVTNAYDPLNRILSTTYSNGPADFDNTPDVAYTYDGVGVPFSTGRLTKVSVTVPPENPGEPSPFTSTTETLAFDALGRVVQNVQTTDGTPYPFIYAYDRDGSLASQSYPSGYQVDFGYDGAGRPVAADDPVTTVANDYASGISYAPHGAISSLPFGNGVTESTTFNDRLQPLQMLANHSTTGQLLKLDFTFPQPQYSGSTYVTGNNGNIATQAITGQGGFSATQSYAYDNLNRLLSMSEGSLSRTFNYDAFGNRAATGTGITGGSPTPQLLTDFDAKNQITKNSADYDEAGNLTTMLGLAALMKYDANNKMAFFDGPTAIEEEGDYFYDGLGQRVKRTSRIEGTDETTTYIYDAFGKLAEEYSTRPPSEPGGTYFRTTDHLGSTRLVTDGNGDPYRCQDFYPFGESIGGLNGRTHACYGKDDRAFKQDFTSKERDGESGLDYFLARYYTPKLGRFNSVDPENQGATLINPQLWPVGDRHPNSDWSEPPTDSKEVMPSTVLLVLCLIWT